MQTIKLGLFTWEPDGRRLSFDGRPVPLGTQAALLFMALAKTPGAVLRSDELSGLVYGAGGNERVAIWELVQSINRALAACVAKGYYVAHHPEHGFRLVTPELAREHPAGFEPSDKPPAPILGRADALLRIARQLETHRFVTILGTGGIGKTTVALALAQRLAAKFPDGAYVIDLSPLADERLVANAISSALGFALSATDPLGSLVAFVRHKRMLIVLDSCENVVTQAAVIAEAILGAAHEIHLLATSREPLLADGEHLHRLAAMALPAPGAKLSVQEALEYSAIDLFVQRVQARTAGFALQEDDVHSVARLCGRLDGIPLAIEMAAARATQLGIRGLCLQLEDDLLSIEAEPGVPARHHTMTAVLDWSYHQLGHREQCALRRLSLFRGSFPLDAAIALIGDLETGPHHVGETVVNLADFSLLAHSPAGDFRLLDTTRAYASAKLQGEERATASHRHAQLLLDVLRQADTDWQHMPSRQWLRKFSEWIDDVRQALDWSFGQAGDVRIGIDLTFAGFSLARQMSLDVEFRVYVEQALVLLESATPRNYLIEITLKAYAGSMGQRIDLERFPQYLSLEQILEKAGSGISPRDKIIAFGSINHAALMAADFAAATQWSARAAQCAQDCADPLAIMITQRMQAQALHFMGHHDAAGELAAQVLEASWRKIPLAYIPSPVEQRVSMRILQARIYWLQGYADRAMQMARECLAQAAEDTAISQCQALAMGALPIAFWTGDTQRCDEYAQTLHEVAQRHSLGYWQYWSERVNLVISLRGTPAGQPVDGRLLKPGVAEANLRDHLCTFDARLYGPDAASRVQTKTVGWCAPEILRIQAESLLQADVPQTDPAESLLRESISMAHRQRALSWLLRSTSTLADLLRRTGRSGEARVQLGLVYGQFNEGLDTADLRAARVLMEQLEGASAGPFKGR